jgi:hypothetical protein
MAAIAAENSAVGSRTVTLRIGRIPKVALSANLPLFARYRQDWEIKFVAAP